MSLVSSFTNYCLGDQCKIFDPIFYLRRRMSPFATKKMENQKLWGVGKASLVLLGEGYGSLLLPSIFWACACLCSCVCFVFYSLSLCYFSYTFTHEQSTWDQYKTWKIEQVFSLIRNLTRLKGRGASLNLNHMSRRTEIFHYFHFCQQASFFDHSSHPYRKLK